MKSSKLNIFAALLLMLPILVSCRNELCYDHFPVMEFSFTWEQEWERDYGREHKNNWDADYFGFGYHDLKPDLPEWVTLVRYTDDDKPDERYLDVKGGRLRVDAGRHQSFLLYNGDTEYIVLSDMASLSDARASATSRSRSSIHQLEERYPDARTTNPPDLLYSAYISEVPGVQNHQVIPMPVKMQPLVYTYHIRYDFEYGIQHVALARGALAGMAESVYLRDGVTSDETAIILFDCSLNSSGCETSVRSFGVPGFPDEYYGRSPSQSQNRPYTLNLEVMLTNGKTVDFNFDITDQMANQPRGGVIKVSGLRIEDDQNKYESGFSVDVSGWGNSEEIDLPVGCQ